MFMNNERHSDVLQNQLKEAVRRKRQVLFSSGVCLNHDNARNHTARHTLKEIQDLSQIWRCYSLSPYSPDLAPRDINFFWPLKDALCGRGRHFRSHEVVKEAVHARLVRQLKTPYPEEFMP
jgi:hypothetical protein